MEQCSLQYGCFRALRAGTPCIGIDVRSVSMSDEALLEFARAIVAANL